MKLETNLIVLATSPQWSSAINRHFPDTNISWVLNTAQLEQAAFSSVNGAVIVELTNESILECCAVASVLQNNSRRWLTIAVGHPTDTNGPSGSLSIAIKSQVQSFGFAYWATSVLQMPVLKSAILNHDSTTIPAFSGSIEERIRLTLPWATASTGDHA